MGEKDVVEKHLARYNDVFADILNGFLFKGRQVVRPEELADAGNTSTYRAEGKIRQLERDVAKRLGRNRVTVALVGMENQTQAARYMPIRVGGYDFQSYRAQLLEKPVRRVYPVFTVVVYFGEKPWPYPRNLMGVVDVTEELRPFVSDYAMKNLFEVAFLEPWQVDWFRSDFRYVVDFFVQRRLTGDYQPPADGAIRHVDAVLKTMTVLTGDERFAQTIGEYPAEGGVTMRDVLDKVEYRGIEKGKALGKAEGKAEGLAEGLALSQKAMAQRMIRGNEPDRKIIEYTGLSESQVKAMRCQMISDSKP